jgi:very-short-patch-repair endonuclease
VGVAPDPEWYFEHILKDAEPGFPGRTPRGPVQQWHTWWRDRERELRGALPAKQGFVLTTAQVRAAGLDQEIRRAVRRGRWSVPAYGVRSPIVVPAADPGDPAAVALAKRRWHALVATAAVLMNPRCVVGGRSAAILHGLPTLAVPDRAEITVRDHGNTGVRNGRLIRSAAVSDPEVALWFGAPLTVVARTVVDLTRHDRYDGIAATDAALYEGLVLRAELDTILAAAAGWPGIKQARDLLALACEKAESPLESWLRLKLHDAGFPKPEPQYWIGPYRADLAWPEARLIAEADGLGKYKDGEGSREKRRDHQVHIRGWHVERVLFSDVFHSWPATEQRLRDVYRARLTA